jgi:hypothetical protein
MVSCLPFYSSRGGQVTILEKEGEKRDVSERYNVKKEKGGVVIVPCSSSSRSTRLYAGR